MKPIEEIGVDTRAIQAEATRQQRQQRRNYRKKIAKVLANRGQSVFASTKLMPRMRRVMRALSREAFQQQKKTGFKTLSEFVKSLK